MLIRKSRILSKLTTLIFRHPCILLLSNTSGFLQLHGHQWVDEFDVVPLFLLVHFSSGSANDPPPRLFTPMAQVHVSLLLAAGWWDGWRLFADDYIDGGGGDGKTGGDNDMANWMTLRKTFARGWRRVELRVHSQCDVFCLLNPAKTMRNRKSTPMSMKWRFSCCCVRRSEEKAVYRWKQSRQLQLQEPTFPCLLYSNNCYQQQTWISRCRVVVRFWGIFVHLIAHQNMHSPKRASRTHLSKKWATIIPPKKSPSLKFHVNDKSAVHGRRRRRRRRRWPSECSNQTEGENAIAHPVK